MANGMGALFVGNSGLRSSQDAINTVANNLANVNTNGYVRQQVVFRDTDYNNLSYSKNGYKKLAGMGASIGDIVHARNVFLDKAFRTENGRQSYYATTFEAVDEVQNYFQELDGVAFQEILTGSENSLWQAFQEFAKNPSDTVNQNMVVQKAGLFVTRAQAVYNGLVNYQKNINAQISEVIDDVNELAQNIYDWNVQIQSIEAGGQETAMNQRDQRDYALDQLSKYGHIEYTEDINGAVSVKFEGEMLVNEAFCYQVGKQTDRMTGYITPYWPHLSNEASGKYVQVLDFNREICTEYDTDIGQLKALVQARGTTVSHFTDMALAPDVYDATTGLSIMQNTQTEFDQLVHGVATGINDLLAPNTTMDDLYVKNEDGTYTHFTNVKVLDEDNCSVGADGKLPPQELFTRTGCERYREVTAKDSVTGELKTYYIYNVEDVDDSSDTYINGKYYKTYDMNHATTVTQCDENGVPLAGAATVPYEPWNKEGNEKYTQQVISGTVYYVYNENYKMDVSKQYTVTDVRLSENLKKQVTNLPHIKYNSPDGEIDYTLGHKLVNLWDEDLLNINPRFSTAYSFGNYYQEMVGEIGIIGSMYETTAENLEGTVESVTRQRDGVIGVSSDEELTKMIKYQNAYNASSRYIQTISDMIESLVTGLGA